MKRKTEKLTENGKLSFLSYTLAAMAGLCFFGGIVVLNQRRA